MYTYKLEDFVNIQENNSPFDANDMIKICKRHNNPKRDFLFVNKYQGKHFPTNYKDFKTLTYALYQAITQKCTSNEKILIIGFAETATALAMQVMVNAIAEKEICPVYYVQTTREPVATTKEPIHFEEEHSHATAQTLYWNNHIKFDTIVMIDDEITTGNTIINLVHQIKKFKPNTRFIAASILNWQNKNCQNRFKEEHIETTYLIKGELKNTTPIIDIKENEPESIIAKTKINHITVIHDGHHPRCGMTPDEITEYITNITNKAKNHRNIEQEKTLIIGTEETMFPAILFTKIHKQALSHSTTRSPIAISTEKNYLINSGSTFHSSYGNDHNVFLYDVPENTYENMIIITEMWTQQFEKEIRAFAHEKGIQNIEFIKLS